MYFRNAVFTADGSIDCEIEHPAFGWLPFTASENDSESHGRDIFASALAANPAPFVVPPEPPVDRAAMQMTFAQLLIGLVAEKWIITAEGMAWLDGALPAAVTALIATLPADQQFAAVARAKRPSVVQRLDGLVLALAALQGRTEAQMDAFFVTYAAV